MAKRRPDLGPRSAWRPAQPVRRRSNAGIALFGVMVGGMIGALVTDPVAWRDVQLALGAEVKGFPELRGRPTRIADGDTFRFGRDRIRLHGVDAPEMSTPQGKPAKAHLEGLIAASPGALRCQDTGDRTYERIVARCYTADNRDLSAAMAEDGWATVMLRFSGWPYLPAQVRAMWARGGMWAS